MVDILKKELKMDFDDAIKHVEKILKEEGFSVLITKAIDEILKQKFDLTDYPKYTIILACNPKLAKLGLDASLNVGLVYPCSFVIYQVDGKNYVSHASIMKIAKEVGLASEKTMEPVIEVTGKVVHQAWDRF